MDLGKAIGADNTIPDPTVVFAPGDTIYASLASKGTASSVEVSARWTYAGHQLVNESTKKITPRGAAGTEFHIAKESG
ncbi:MAG: hypothetical protein ACREQL_13995, partial [Candidatus Binatia bacterium]